MMCVCMVYCPGRICLSIGLIQRNSTTKYETCHPILSLSTHTHHTHTHTTHTPHTHTHRRTPPGNGLWRVFQYIVSVRVCQCLPSNTHSSEMPHNVVWRHYSHSPVPGVCVCLHAAAAEDSSLKARAEWVSLYSFYMFISSPGWEA